jgi:hypothetical protein
MLADEQTSIVFTTLLFFTTSPSFNIQYSLAYFSLFPTTAILILDLLNKVSKL